MTSKIDIKNWLTGAVIFSYECEKNTIKKTVEEAIKQDINLGYADLKNTDLSFARLDYANLSYANLSNADLSFARLNYANLSYANLSNADLERASLFNAKLIDANLSNANLEGAVLFRTVLSSSNLSNANLIWADLRNAILINANLKGTDLRNAILDCAILDKADLSNAKIDYPMFIPEGEFIAWKEVNGKYIIKLKILEDSKRSCATTFKCRCDKALVLEIQNLDGSKADLSEVVNYNYKRCTYKVGEIVEADSWDENRFNECSHGIHFFLNRELAIKRFRLNMPR